MIAETHLPYQELELTQHSRNFPAVGVIRPEATILTPAVAEDIEVVMASENTKIPFTVTHEGELTEMDKFGNRYANIGVNSRDTALNNNLVIGAALEWQVKQGRDFSDAFEEVARHLKGTFSIIATQDSDLYVARDRYGEEQTIFIGELATGGFVASSQEESIKELNGESIEQIEPGTVACIGAQCISSYKRWAYPVHKQVNP